MRPLSVHLLCVPARSFLLEEIPVALQRSQLSDGERHAFILMEKALSERPHPPAHISALSGGRNNLCTGTKRRGNPALLI